MLVRFRPWLGRVDPLAHPFGRVEDEGSKAVHLGILVEEVLIDPRDVFRPG